MQYEDIIYPAGILAMAVRLEEFLREEILSGQVAANDGLGALIGKFKVVYGKNPKEKKSMSDAVTLMTSLNDWRKDCAHPFGRKITGDTLKKARKTCKQLDALMEKKFGGKSPELGKIMMSCSLRYDMGNAGDIIKHGVLAEFVQWWLQDRKTFRYADPFGGRPWGMAKSQAAARVESMHKQGFALGFAQRAEEQLASKHGITTYYGSSHVVMNICGKRATVFADDVDKLAREDLRESGVQIISASREFPNYSPDNGYAILDYAAKASLDMVLVDPYKEFMGGEFSRQGRVSGSPMEARFANIVKATEKPENKNLWVAVFVLDWEDVEDEYRKFRKDVLGNCAVGLRCDRLGKHKRLDGEKSYDMEIVLVSNQLRQTSPDDRTRELLQRLLKLEDGVEGAIRISDSVSSFGIRERLSGENHAVGMGKRKG